jgi:ABC-type spermidine/putrescine transport system permease subunit II
MKKKISIGSKLYITLMFIFFYLPIAVTMFFSFNSSKSLTNFSGFSLRWYKKLLTDSNIISAVYVSVSIAVIATIVSTILGTMTAIGLSKSKKVLKEWLLNVNNMPIMNPDIVRKNGTWIYDNASGTYSFLHTVCNYKCLSKSQKYGPQSGRRGNGLRSHTISGIDKGNSSNAKAGNLCRNASCIYNVD